MSIPNFYFFCIFFAVDFWGELRYNIDMANAIKKNPNLVTFVFDTSVPNMTREEAIAELKAELKKGEDSFKVHKGYTIEESKRLLGLI